MGRRTVIDPDAFRAAYLETLSQVEAAKALGFSDRTVNRRRLDDPEFAEMLEKTKAEVDKIRQDAIEAGRPHGTRTRYAAGCHCDACRRANTEAQREANARRRARAAEAPAEVPHGVGGYRNHGCRCDECRESHALDVAEYRIRRQRERRAA